MSAHAYSEPYAHDRRHARALARQQQKTTRLKSAEVINLIPRQVKLDKPIELVYPKYRRVGISLFSALVVGLHVLVFGYFYYQPIAEAVKKVEIPVIKLERYTPPVIPPQVVEQPKVTKKEQPKPTPQKKVVTENPNIIEEYVVPAPVDAAPTSVGETITEASASAAYLHNPPPVYPETAQEKGWEGTVILSVLVQADGKAKSVEVKTSSGRKILDQAATQTVKRWTFAPARRGETPVEGWVEVPIDFRLDS